MVEDNAPPDWLEILNESEAELVAGHIVSGETVHRELQASIARLQTKAASSKLKATSRR
jgi:hypothetical protein